MTITTDRTDLLALAPTAQELLFRDARTANTFTSEPVTEEQIEAVYDLVKWAPTAANTQPLRVLLVRSGEARERLVEHMEEGNKAKTLTAPLTAVLTADVDFHEHAPRLFPHKETLRDDLAGHPGREQMATFNGALQAGYFILGVRAAGLAAGPMAGFDAAGVEKEFFPEGNRRVLMVINIGKPGPDAYYPRNVRLSYDEVYSAV